MNNWRISPPAAGPFKFDVSINWWLDGSMPQDMSSYSTTPNVMYSCPLSFLSCPFRFPSLFLYRSSHVPSLSLYCPFIVPLAFLSCTYTVPWLLFIVPPSFLSCPFIVPSLFLYRSSHIFLLSIDYPFIASLSLSLYCPFIVPFID